jgi:hypothetical protein
MDKDSNLQDNWATVVLALATTGGIILDLSPKKHQIIISAIGSKDNIQKGELDYLYFTVSASDLKKILSEARELQREVETMVDEMDKEKETPCKNKPAVKVKTAKVVKTTTLEKRKAKRIYPPIPQNVPDDIRSVEEPEPIQMEGDVIDYDDDIDKIG